MMPGAAAGGNARGGPPVGLPGMGPPGGLAPVGPGGKMGGAGQVVGPKAGPGDKGTVTLIIRDKDQFSTRRQKGATVITVTGTVVDGKAKVSTVEIKTAAGSDKYQRLDQVPKKYRGKVKELIALSEKDRDKADGEKP
jgi:hypothetical protein